ncbi:MAG: ribosomal RNA small subunit methyltransferase A [Crenarchaeota archaeon]|nr:ribosomal RNA small subunit methyltransferase A [Thermoproteota archaeon]
MSLDEIQSILQNHQIKPNNLLGQNFLVDTSLFPLLCNYAELNYADVVLDAGAGFGFLTQYLAKKCKSVIAVEKDSKIAKILKENVKNYDNITVKNADILDVVPPAFNKIISLPPYYLSSQFVTWLLQYTFDYAVIVVQKEFAQKLVAPPGSEAYGWLTVISSVIIKAELLDEIPNWKFFPQPEVDSIILRLKPRLDSQITITNMHFFTNLTKWLFTQRNKKISNALIPFLKNECGLNKTATEEIVHKLHLREKRARELTPIEFGELANELAN